IEKNIYEYFNVIPCYKYKVIPYIKYHIKPDNDDPQRVLIIGKYNSMLFDLFDVNVVYEVNNHNNINKISLGCEHPGIIQHNTEIHNPTWNDVNFINSWKKLPKLTRICFTYDKCKILGKRNPTWTFKNLQTEKEIVIKSKYAAYLFKESGNYSVSLELYDSNKNKYIATKNYFTIV
ncbi:MAG: hypothetical protein IKO36_03035, partial [Bacteroidaceae bacterium]|nr:hypothetical protein [Bacteroidaceae bacterium]